MTTKKIFGPPGTGKTHTLLSIVEEALDNGIEPNKIGYFSFTQKAAKEAISRAVDRFPQYDKKDFKYFRTLHSLAYIELGLGNDSMMDDDDYKELSDKLNIKVSNPNQKLKQYGVSWQDDAYLQVYDLSRIKQVSLEHQFMHPDTPFLKDGEIKLRKIARGFEQYKKDNKFMDFTDMIIEYTKRKTSPRFEVLIIDEAQDLSSIQWDLVELLSRSSKSVYIAGDDDQAVFKWAGASPERFLRLKGEQVILNQSYRVPLAVQEKAVSIINRIPENERVMKNWNPRDFQGLYKKHNFVFFNNFNLHNNDWLILARTKYHLDNVEKELKKTGVFYSRYDKKSISDRLLNAIISWTDISRGKSVSLKSVKDMYSYMKVDEDVAHGFKTMPRALDTAQYTYEDLKNNYGLLAKKDMIWRESMSDISDSKAQYVKKMLENKQNLKKDPDVRLSTIHASKGGQASNVLLFSDTSSKADEAYRRNKSDERRVFYVGMTRAKEQLHVVRSETMYEFGELFWS